MGLGLNSFTVVFSALAAASRVLASDWIDYPANGIVRAVVLF